MMPTHWKQRQEMGVLSFYIYLRFSLTNMKALLCITHPTKMIKKEGDFMTINFFDKCGEVCQKNAVIGLLVLTSLLAFIMVFLPFS